MSISEILKHKRKELNLTLLEIANKVGVTEATVQRWESGNIKNLRHERIVKLADALEITPAYLMGWEEKNPPAQMDERIWKNICSNNTKLILATWIAELEGDDLAKVSSVLAAILEKRIPPAPQV